MGGAPIWVRRFLIWICTTASANRKRFYLFLPLHALSRLPLGPIKESVWVIQRRFVAS